MFNDLEKLHQASQVTNHQIKRTGAEGQKSERNSITNDSMTQTGDNMLATPPQLETLKTINVISLEDLDLDNKVQKSVTDDHIPVFMGKIQKQKNYRHRGSMNAGSSLPSGERKRLLSTIR